MSVSLRVWAPSEDSESEGEVRTDGPTQVSAEITIAEFVELSLVPELAASERAAGTITIYRDAARWWSKLTPDPPVREIDSRAVADFRSRLSEAHYRRGPGGGWRRLSAWSQTKVLRTLRAILRRLGPGTDTRPGEDLLRKPPRLIVSPPRARAKETWTLAEAQAVLARVDVAEAPRLAGSSPADWWRAFFALAAYTGLRKGTLLGLRRRHLVEKADGWWLEIEGDCVTKTGKDTRVALHALALEAVRRLPTGEPNDLLLPWPLRRRSGAKSHDPSSAIRKQHDAIVAAAGAPRYEIHAWRRWHVSQLVGLGGDALVEAARLVLGHSSRSITLDHYAGTAALSLARQLPALW